MKLSKQALMMSAVALCLIGGADRVFAQEQKNWSVALGLKLWLNNWATFSTPDDPTTGTHVTGFTSDAKAAALPSLTFKYKDVFLNLGAFTKTSYDFPASSEIENLGGALGNRTVTDKLTAKRSEMDLNLGWYFHPQLAVTLGYKTVKQEYTDTVSSPGVVFSQPTSNSTTKYKIPTIGLLGNARIGDTRWFMYGSGAYGPKISASFSPSGGTAPSGWYATSDIGVGYAFSKNFTATAGYKTQVIHQTTNTTGGPAQVAPDATYGLIAGVNVIF